MGIRSDNWKIHLGGLGIIAVGVAWVWIIHTGAQAMQAKTKTDPRPPSPTYNYWHPGWKGKTALDTMRAIMPNGIGVITYGDTLTDSIRWSSEPFPTYTKEDSIRDHIARMKHINSIEPLTPPDY